MRFAFRNGQNSFRQLTTARPPPRSPSILLNTLRSRTMATTTSERFLADRAAPLCSLNVAKSFGLLRRVFRLVLGTPADVVGPVRKKSCTRTTLARPHGPADASSRANGPRRGSVSTTYSFSHLRPRTKQLLATYPGYNRRRDSHPRNGMHSCSIPASDFELFRMLTIHVRTQPRF